MHERAPDISITTAAAESAEAREIARALAAHVGMFGPRDEQSLTLVARDGEGHLAGGLNAISHWRWLYIRHVWIAPEHRSIGLGGKLLAAAEKEARAQGCVGLYLDTFDADAERFYERCGYQRFGALADFPPGHIRRFLRKTV